MENSSNKIEIICSKCGKIPEFLKVHTDNSKIEFNCKQCGKYELLINEFINELSKENYFKKCGNCIKRGLENKYYYCFFCKKDYCENCIKNDHSKHDYIESKKKKNICLNHNKEFKYFCFKCKENICEEEIKENGKHKEHKIEEISKTKESESLNANKKDIEEINKYLKNLVEFNDLLLNKSEIIQNKDFYINSIKNMGKSLKEGNERNSKDIKCLLTRLKVGISKSIDAIDALIDKDIHLHRFDKSLYLNNKELYDEGFKLISQISFNQLKEIDLSENKIKDIQAFKKMSLPFLEFLNLSHNEIDKIEPITKINSKELEYLFLQKNHIEDIETFLDSNFEKIKLLRVEDYNTNFSNQNFNDEVAKERIEKKRIENLNKIKSKYPEGFIYKSIDEQKKEFKKKYELDYDISWDNEFINLPDLKGGQKMLKALFLIITYMPKNNINKLILRNNDIKDPSMLKWVNFNKLETLDLAVNKINHLTFLLEMKAENLKYLYLDNNEFKEIHQIINSNFPKLEVLSINENDFDSFEMKDSPIFKKLKKKNIKIEKKEKVEEKNQIFIQLDEENENANENLPEEQNSNS